MSGSLRKMRRQQERRSDSPMKVLQGLSNLNGLADLSGKIDELVQAAGRLESLVEVLDGAEGLVETVVEIKNTFDGLVERQVRQEKALKHLVSLLIQFGVGNDLDLEGVQKILGDQSE